MTENIDKNRILILDFGSQYTQLLARRIRELGVYCELWTYKVSETQIYEFRPSGIILSGGPESATEENSPRAPKYVFKAGVPVLGICYGMQIMALQLGGRVQKSVCREFGYSQVKVLINNSLTQNLQDGIDETGKPVLDVWMSHSDTVTIIPNDFIAIANTKNCQFAIIANEKKRFYGLQFHPEVTHTIQGKRLLERFILGLCHCKPLWTTIKIIKNKINYIKKKIGNDRVILGLSGGIDSSVTAMLLHRAIGERLICVFIDNGLLRLNEASQIITTFNRYCSLKITHVKAEKRFLMALSGINEPEEKRKIIGRVFIEIFEEQARKVNIKWLAQGTTYPDIIESSVSLTGKSHIIKSHHNVGGLPKEMKIKLVEPIKELFKDEVRRIGLELGIPKNIIFRHPFPGPGLGIRILKEVKKEYCDLLRNVDEIFIKELHKANLYKDISQAFSVLLPVNSVGVIGDKRQYGFIISLRAVKTVDFMTAEWVRLPYDLLDHVSNRIINEVHGVSRVVYDISGKPPATIEWE